ncbi:PDR/VanB family oxidoreductase [Nocardia pseudovaccinii]|uniref:PDR/VanB family oxidoreductase n=1 Tax=Nocardia pseudovaccinii TaxID=189540 RepID=UPI003D8D542A
MTVEPMTATSPPNDAGNAEDCFPLAVIGKRLVAEGVVALVLGSRDGSDLPGWAPGAHLDICLDNGLTRQYSLFGDPADRRSYTVGVLRVSDSRGGSSYIHDVLRVGDEVRVRGPRNHFELVAAESYLFIAGGIGITPIAPMIRQVEAQGSEWRLVYGGRTFSSMALRSELAELGGSRVEFWPQDERGIIDLAAVLSQPSKTTAVYACGPEPLLEAVESTCAAGWPPGALHLERFAAKAPASDQVDTDFEVEIASSGQRIAVPSGSSVLVALENAGIFVTSGCQEGVCGTCETRVLHGEPDHRDSVLSAEEQSANDCMMLCVSRARGPLLVLDL